MLVFQIGLALRAHPISKLLVMLLLELLFTWCNKYLMTGPLGNSDFCFPKSLNVSLGKSEGNIEVERK